MPDELRLLLGFATAGITTLLLVPVVVRLARRTGFYDHPVGYKSHSAPTPYLGGLAIMGGFVVGALATGGVASEYVTVIALAVGLCAVGTLDDWMSLGPFKRLFLEVVAGIALWMAGLGWDVFGLDGLDIAITAAFVVGLVNAFNLMDNLDGAAGTVGAVAATGAGLLAAAEGDAVLGALAVALAGGCAAFLSSNLVRPARIFMGDGGSMPLGFVVAAALMSAPVDGRAGWVVVLAALPIAGLPILDMTLVIVSRRRRGAPVLTGARDHLTHRLLPRLGSPAAVALVLGAAQATLCLAGIALLQLERSEMLGGAVGLLLIGFAAIAVLEQPLWATQRQES